MQDADQLLKDGDVDGARAALVDTVRSNPSSQPARMFLFQLLCVAGEWEKARRQLAALAQLSPEAQMLSVAYGQAIDAEAEREAVFAGRSRAVQLVASDWAEPLTLAIEHFAKGEIEQGDAARDQAFEAAPSAAGELDGTRFEWLADADGRFGPAFEAIIAGRYGIVPFDVIERVESEGPRDLRDIVWYPVQIAFKDGQSVAAMLPARYPGSEQAEEISERLARSTGWVDRPWGQAGSGQRLLTLAGEEDRGLLSLRSLVFD